MMDPKIALARAVKRYRLSSHVEKNGETVWMVTDMRDRGGAGIYGDEAAGQSYYAKTLMFRALESMDKKHDWHEYEWHTLTGTAEERIAQMLKWRAEWEEARAAVEPFQRLVEAVCRGAR